jgi:diphosphomevalonate decarboxylase
MSTPLRYQATAASNIALLKYWGKQRGHLQWPANPSLSLTLSSLKSITTAAITAAADHQLLFNGEIGSREKPDTHKIFLHLDRLAAECGSTAKLTITTYNSFPTACGIASSASGFAALTIAGLAALYGAQSLGELADTHQWTREKMATLARRGSGSACRSFWGGIVEWLPGDAADRQCTGQIYDEHYWALMDTVILISRKEKPTSSSSAHDHAWSSPFFGPRLAGIAERHQALHAALAARSMEMLGPIIEQEALEMHAVMMSAEPSTRFFGEETAAFLSWLRVVRQREGLPLYFTLDAGPNVHIIGESSAQKRLHTLLKFEQPEYSYLCDRLGAGPELTVLS